MCYIRLFILYNTTLSKLVVSELASHSRDLYRLYLVEIGLSVII
jgi:hypothetical protein